MSQLIASLGEDMNLPNVDPSILDNMVNGLNYENGQEDTKNEFDIYINSGQQQQMQVQTLLPHNAGEMYNHVFRPLIPSQIPATEEFAGHYNFEILLNNQTCGKYAWVYSVILNKVFIKLQNTLPVIFKWEPPIPDLCVRATPLFTLPQYAQEPVVRCLSHSSDSDPSNRGIPRNVSRHILRCNNPNTQYCGTVNDRLSVVTPLETPQAGVDFVRMMYQFMCQNSCTSGMNRRQIDVVYTLEAPNGEILGRRKHEVRICSCPRRDKEKEEDDLKKKNNEAFQPKPKKRKIQIEPMPLPSGKKIAKGEPPDNEVYTVPSFTVVGRENVLKILDYSYNLMSGAAIRQNNFETYQQPLAEIDSLYKNFSQ